MRARHVRLGAIVKDDAGRWQVVVDIHDLTDDAGRMLELVYASEQSESMQPGDNVEVVKLTAVQIDHLRAAGAGGLLRSMSGHDLYKPLFAGQARRASRTAVGRLQRLRLLTVGPVVRGGERLDPSQAGAALLAILDGKTT